MIVLNYIYFIIYSYLCVYFMLLRRKIVVNPLNTSQKLAFHGTEALWVLIFSTGTVAFSAPGLIDLMAIRLLIFEIVFVVGLIYAHNKPSYNFPLFLYTLFFLWMIVGLFYTSSTIFGIRVILKYLYSFLIIIFASAVVYNKEVAYKGIIFSRYVAIVCVLALMIPSIGNILFRGVFWYATGSAINFIGVAMMSSALYFYGGKKTINLLLAIAFCIPCFIWVFRTSIAGTFVATSVFLFFRYKIGSLPMITGMLILAVSAVFFIPSLHDKMFVKGDEVTLENFTKGDVETEDINTNARSTMWEWALSNNYKGKEMIGSGTGHLQEVSYSDAFAEFSHGGSRGIVHSDYVQMLCDNGLIGIVLFGLSFLSMIIHCFIVFTRKHSTAVKICAISAGSTIAGVLFTLYSDNVVNYSMATFTLPCGLYGMMLGLIKGENEATPVVEM